ncbi:MAG: tetratricopeptide repeat protein [Hylemonella sp.]|nr:tetratricopeptide repeat protein [Hylemonella sp.]
MSEDDLEQAKASFLQGLQASDAGDWQSAERHFEQALARAPGRISVMQNLGITRVRLGRHAEAQPLLHDVLAAESGRAEVWQALAQTQLELHQFKAAAASYERCLALGMDSATLRAQYAQCLARQGRVAEATHAYQEALQRDAGLTGALIELGSLHREAGQLEQAASCFRRALDSGADPDVVGYFLAAVTHKEGVTAPPPQYVRDLFDQYAPGFDAHLVGQLGYQGHQLLVDRLPPEAGARFSRALDLGCGTGLCGAHVRPRVDQLVGVDLAPAMIEQARQRALYDALHVGDIHEFLVTAQEPYDLVLAADVFIYVGALEPVFGLLSQRMRPGSWLAFTVESAAPGQTVQLLPSLRYAHSAAYLRDLADRHGFEMVAVCDDAIRFDQRQAVSGQFVYLRRR